MIKINLLPYRDILRKQTIITHAVVAVLVVAMVVVTTTAVDLFMRSKIKHIRTNIARVEKEISSNKVSLEEIDKLKKEKEVYARQFQIIENLRKDKGGPVRILDELTKIIPDKMWILTLKQTANSVELVGVAVENKLISKFMTELEESPYFKKVDLISSEMKTESAGKSKEKLNKFTLICLIESPPQG